MKEKDIYKLLAMTMSIGNSNTYGDYYIFSNEKLMNYSVGLVLEIDELLNMGYGEDEINKMIMECDFMKKDFELTKEDVEYLRNYALRLLPIRYELYLKEKDKKVKKHLFNK